MYKIICLAALITTGATAAAQTNQKNKASFTPPVIAKTEATTAKFTPPVIRKKPVRKVKKEQSVFTAPVFKKDN